MDSPGGILAKTIKIFPSQIYQRQLLKPDSDLNRCLIKDSKRVRTTDKVGKKWSEKKYLGGYTSYGSMNDLYNISPSFFSLHELLKKEAAVFAKILQMNISADELFLSAMWINIMPKGGSHNMHFHPQSVISGTYYLQVPPGSSGLVFEDPRLPMYMANPLREKKASIENRWSYELKPKAGQLVLFEGWLRHGVPANPSSRERISISFNFVCKRGP